MPRRQWIVHALLELIPRVHSYVRGLAHNDHLVQEIDNRKVLVGSLYRRIYTLDVIGYIRIRTTTCILVYSIRIMSTSDSSCESGTRYEKKTSKRRHRERGRHQYLMRDTETGAELMKEERPVSGEIGREWILMVRQTKCGVRMNELWRQKR